MRKLILLIIFNTFIYSNVNKTIYIVFIENNITEINKNMIKINKENISATFFINREIKNNFKNIEMVNILKYKYKEDINWMFNKNNVLWNGKDMADKIIYFNKYRLPKVKDKILLYIDEKIFNKRNYSEFNIFINILKKNNWNFSVYSKYILKDTNLSLSEDLKREEYKEKIIIKEKEEKILKNNKKILLINDKINNLDKKEHNILNNLKLKLKDIEKIEEEIKVIEKEESKRLDKISNETEKDILIAKKEGLLILEKEKEKDHNLAKLELKNTLKKTVNANIEYKKAIKEVNIKHNNSLFKINKEIYKEVNKIELNDKKYIKRLEYLKRIKGKKKSFLIKNKKKEKQLNEIIMKKEKLKEEKRLKELNGKEIELKYSKEIMLIKEEKRRKEYNLKKQIEIRKEEERIREKKLKEIELEKLKKEEEIKLKRLFNKRRLKKEKLKLEMVEKERIKRIKENNIRIIKRENEIKRIKKVIFLKKQKLKIYNSINKKRIIK